MLLAGPCPMGLPASSRCRKSHCRRWRPWTWPGVWCSRGGPLLRMRSWRSAGRLVRTKKAIFGKGSPKSVSVSRMPPAVTALELSGSSSGVLPDSKPAAGRRFDYGLDLSAVVSCACEHAATGR